jgi:hypothetical protein
MDRVILQLEGLLEQCRAAPRRAAIAARVDACRAGGARIVVCSSAGAGLVAPHAGRTIDDMIRALDDYGIVCDELFLSDPGTTDALMVVDDKAVTFDEFVDHDDAEVADLLAAEAVRP